MSFVVAQLSVERVRKGLPIVIHDPAEMALLFAVLVVFVVPIYLSYRRRSFRRTLDQ